MSRTTSFKVRSATLRDARAIADLHQLAAQESFKPLLGHRAIPAPMIEKRPAYWREAIEYAEPQICVVMDDDKLVGFVGFDRSRDKGTPPTTGEIWALYVTPSCWGQGAGLALWDAAREGLHEEGCNQVSVWVPLASARALRFLELAGFKREMNTAKTVPMGAIRVEEIRLSRALG